jgi:hypothetical protein
MHIYNKTLFVNCHTKDRVDLLLSFLCCFDVVNMFLVARFFFLGSREENEYKRRNQ